MRVQFQGFGRALRNPLHVDGAREDTRSLSARSHDERQQRQPRVAILRARPHGLAGWRAASSARDSR